MPQNLFLSHDSRDQALANALGAALQRMTLGQIAVWHSSDGSGAGGLRPGQVWLDEIRSQLSRSRAVVTLLTPQSLAKPWILFESGFGAANPSCDVIPVCIGIDSLSGLPFPLAMYQTYQLADYDSVKRFVEKLFHKYEIQFDEEMAKPVLSDLIQKLVQQQKSESETDDPRPDASIETAIAEIKAHIDLRVHQLASTSQSQEESPTRGSFSIQIDLRAFSPSASDQFLEISPEMSIQDVLDGVYYMLPGMAAFQYLREWILRESATDIKLVVREVGSRIPAHSVFKAGSRWRAVKLVRPYSPKDSANTERWYGR